MNHALFALASGHHDSQTCGMIPPVQLLLDFLHLLAYKNQKPVQKLRSK